MKKNLTLKFVRNSRSFMTLAVAFLGTNLMTSCDTTGSSDDPKPDPIEQVDPKTAISLEKIKIEKFGLATQVALFPENGNSIGLLTGDGEYTFKLSADLEKFKNPDISGQETDAFYFTEDADTLWMFKNDVLTGTYTMRKGQTATGVPYSYIYTDQSTVGKLSSEKYIKR